MSLDINTLNAQQQIAVEETDGPCLIIAGAGSGKTRVLTYKVSYLLEKGINPYQILALTFTNKAADVMKERILKLTDNKPLNIWMGTFHSMFARILRTEANSIGFTPNFSIYDTTDSLNLIKAIMVSLEMSTDKLNPYAVQSAISKLKNQFILPEEFEKNSVSLFDKAVSKIYEIYRLSLIANNSMDFDDLLLYPVLLFEKNKHILEKYQNRFRYILVDEYQDTNRAQYLILKMLSGKHNNISVVGDDAQSIYKWRGAQIQNIFDFQDDFPGCKLFRLEQNYRSTGKILELADSVIKNNRHQIKKDLWTKNESGELIRINEYNTDNEESSKIIKIISEEIRRNKLYFKDFAVLYRTNAQSRILEEHFKNFGIPYLIVGSIRFYERKEIKDIVAHLKIVVNPKDNESLIRVLKLRQGIGDTTIDKLKLLADKSKKQIYEIIADTKTSKIFSSRTKNLLTQVINFIYKYQILKDEIKLTEFVRGIIDETGIVQKYRIEETPESEERINNINELISAVAQFENTDEEASIETFLQKVLLLSEIDEVDDRKNAVTLMTVHSAKGLESPVVFITGMEEGLFPVSGSIMDNDDLEEERRLFYVGITRAMKKLYISYANQRYRFGTNTYMMRSRFIKEIPQNLFDSILKFEKNGMRHRQQKLEKRSTEPVSIRYEYYESAHLNDSDEDFGEFSDIRKNTEVFHNIFGKGTVIATYGRGINKKADIKFDDSGIKKIVLKYAKMRVKI
ncbi:MAG: DNA helicase [Ignavibacteria bacterium]|nr:DNA helicase [Ignavibacteria bacterium]